MSDDKTVTSDLKPVTDEEIKNWRTMGQFPLVPDDEVDIPGHFIERLIADLERHKAALRKVCELVGDNMGTCPLDLLDDPVRCGPNGECDDDTVACWMAWAQKPDKKGEGDE